MDWKMSSNGEIALRLESPFHWSRQPQIAFHQVIQDREYRVSLNGGEARVFSGSQLEKGIAIGNPTESKGK
jgi:hypothetical protein